MAWTSASEGPICRGTKLPEPEAREEGDRGATVLGLVMPEFILRSTHAPRSIHSNASSALAVAGASSRRRRREHGARRGAHAARSRDGRMGPAGVFLESADSV